MPEDGVFFIVAVGCVDDLLDGRTELRQAGFDRLSF